MQQSIFVGLDLGSNRCQQTIINSDGSFVSSRSIPTSEFHLRSAFAGLGKQACVHLEASDLASWVSSVISPLVREVVCFYVKANKFRPLDRLPSFSAITRSDLRLNNS